MGGLLIANNIAIIPARGGSKRLPRKNIMDFWGRPIINYTIEAARNCKLFDVVVVSTEDQEVIKCVRDTGCEVHERSPEFASDTARVTDVIKEVLTHYKNMGKEFHNLCCLYATAPLRDAADIRNAYQLMLSKNADFCMGVTEYLHSPFFAYDIDKEGRINRRWPQLAKLPRWKKPNVVAGNGSMYWAKVKSFLESGELDGPNTLGYMMPAEKSVDIDTENDFKLAEYYAKYLIPKSS